MLLNEVKIKKKNKLSFILNKLNKISGKLNILDRKYFNKIEICKLLGLCIALYFYVAS